MGVGAFPQKTSSPSILSALIAAYRGRLPLSEIPNAYAKIMGGREKRKRK
jgi:hypothetical protein